MDSTVTPDMTGGIDRPGPGTSPEWLFFVAVPLVSNDSAISCRILSPQYLPAAVTCRCQWQPRGTYRCRVKREGMNGHERLPRFDNFDPAGSIRFSGIFPSVFEC
ncbi:MAG: hypothetical protein ACLQMU_11790 [Methanoregula sp.]|uniref:hypothetical protein n=1 Tax=Methanoregula sp. TaxID=2052170 RepID=UPI003C5D9088